MIDYTGNLDKHIQLLGVGMKAEIERRIKTEVQTRVDEIVEKLAKEIAHDMVVNLKSWNNMLDDQITVQLIINKKEIK